MAKQDETAALFGRRDHPAVEAFKQAAKQLHQDGKLDWVDLWRVRRVCRWQPGRVIDEMELLAETAVETGGNQPSDLIQKLTQKAIRDWTPEDWVTLLNGIADAIIKVAQELIGSCEATPI